MEKDDTYIKGIEDEIKKLIGLIRSYPTPELLNRANDLLRTVGVDPGLLTALNQVVITGTQQVGAAMSGGLRVDLGTLTKEQQGLVYGFYSALSDFQKDVKEYASVLAEFELKEAELKKLNATIMADPFSDHANEARTLHNAAVLDMIHLSASIRNHDNTCERRLEQCNAKRGEIERDGTLTDVQREALKKLAEGEIEAVENELREIRGKVSKHDKTLVEHLEIALRDQIAIEYSSSKDDYDQVVKKGLSDDDKKEISGFVQGVVTSKDIHAGYKDFTEKFITRKVEELKVAPVKEEVKAEAAEQQGKTRRSRANLDKANKASTEETRSFVEKEMDRKADRHDKDHTKTR